MFRKVPPAKNKHERNRCIELQWKKPLVASLLAIGIVVGGGAISASAGTGDGTVDNNEIGFYFSQDENGSLWDSVYFTSTQFRFHNDTTSPWVTFISGGTGQGQKVRNNAASVWNRNPYKGLIYYSPNFGGYYDTVPAKSARNLSSSIRNNNASFQIVE